MSVEEQRAERERDREAQMEQTAATAGLQSGGPAAEAMDTNKSEYLESLIDNEDIQSGLADDLRNLLSRDFILGNLERGDYTELKWLGRHELQTLLCDYPKPRSVMTGWRRQAYYDGDASPKEPLSSQKRYKIETMVMSYIARLSRSKDAEQLEHFERTTSRVETVKSDDEGDGFFDGGFL